MCAEVCRVRPQKLLEWLEVAEALNDTFSTESNEVHLKGRGCKERLHLLSKKYDSEDKRSLKRLVIHFFLFV